MVHVRYHSSPDDRLIISTARNAEYCAKALSPVHTSNNVEATLSKQRSTLSSKGRNLKAKLVRHCCRFWQQSRTLLRHCCWCGPGFMRRKQVHCGFVKTALLRLISATPSGVPRFDSLFPCRSEHLLLLVMDVFPNRVQSTSHRKVIVAD